MIIRMIVAAGIGFGLLTGGQHLWVASMQQRLDQVANSPSTFPVGQAVTVDTDKMMQSFKPTQFDTTAFQSAGMQSQFRDMELRNRAAQSGAPQIANGIPTMPGQANPNPFQFGIPGVPHR